MSKYESQFKKYIYIFKTSHRIQNSLFRVRDRHSWVVQQKAFKWAQECQRPVLFINRPVTSSYDVKTNGFQPMTFKAPPSLCDSWGRGTVFRLRFITFSFLQQFVFFGGPLVHMFGCLATKTTRAKAWGKTWGWLRLTCKLYLLPMFIENKYVWTMTTSQIHR